jgi:outer membrane protein, heavy metal efflux system
MRRILKRFPLRGACSLAQVLALMLALPVHAELVVVAPVVPQAGASPKASAESSPRASHAVPTSLAQAFAAAWARQPAAQSLVEQRSAAAARRTAADAWTPEPPAIELGGRSDRFNRDRGANELELGLAIPLWLPGERDGSQALAEAESGWLEGRSAALQWQLAGELRNAWWDWQLAREDLLAAEGLLSTTSRLRDDVARRVAVGDLARTDLQQAQGAFALARIEQADAQGRHDAAASRLFLLTGQSPLESGVAAAGGHRPLNPQQAGTESDPGESVLSVQSAEWLARHPALLALMARAESARQTQALARTRSRGNPELMLATRRERGATGEAIEQSWSLALRVPLASSARHNAAIADAGAGRVEAEIELLRERERLQQGAALASQQLAAARLRLQASEERARLARDTDAAYAKSFRLGESDLPTRLRIAQDAFTAERAVQRARIQLAASLSAYRQALGLLPE